MKVIPFLTRLWGVVRQERWQSRPAIGRRPVADLGPSPKSALNRGQATTDDLHVSKWANEVSGEVAPEQCLLEAAIEKSQEEAIAVGDIRGGPIADWLKERWSNLPHGDEPAAIQAQPEKRGSR